MSVRTKAVAMLAGAVTFAGLGATQAVAAPGERQGTARAASFTIPRNFLLHEAEYRKTDKPWQKARFSDSRTRARVLDPCHRKRRPDGERVAARTIALESEADWHAEQLVVYKDERQARAGWAALRADLARCRKGGKGHDRYEYRLRPVRIGDEALLVGGVFFENKLVYAAARRGRAIVVYARTGQWTKSFQARHFGAVERDARTMARKVCELPGVC